MAKLYRTVSLFSGAMGLDIGLENTGRFETIGAVESNKTFVESLRANKDAGNLTNETLRVTRGMKYDNCQSSLKRL